MSKSNERFVCKLPHIDVDEKKPIEYDGPTAGNILETMLYKDKMCSYLVDVYWTYQVCHGRYVIQFHEDKMISGKVSRTEFYLGNFDVALTASTNEQLKPQTRRIENEDYPYYSVTYNHGTTCDVTGKPRVTDVVYICVEKVQHKILSVTEVSSCHYEIIIMTDLLCRHPEYQLSEKKDHKILCWNEDAKDEQEAKPRTLQRLDDFHDSTFRREYSIDEGEQGEHVEQEEDNIIDSKEFERIREIQNSGFFLSGEKSIVFRFKTKESLANNPTVVHHTVNRILTGEDCIVGGTGWWKYEFCYGKQIIQYHEDANGQRADILLGVFDEVLHKEWVKLDPGRRGAIKESDQIRQLNIIYTKGDICDETGAHRDVEVRIRCATADNSALAFSMHLTEPNTCQYVLTIASERFCEPLQYADDFGLIEITPIQSSSQIPSSLTREPMKVQEEEEEEDRREEEEEEEHEEAGDVEFRIHEDL
uniref:Endoplasmic reticulum lectin 1 n=1 Tax=Caenorhabditis tropicalis TaxID=1561998 RepID=A0A1I7UT17_9PELO